MSAKSTPHILSLNCEYTFLLLNFLITGLCNSSAKILLFFIHLPDKVFLLSGAAFESKKFIYGLPHELPNDLRLKILGN